MQGGFCLADALKLLSYMKSIRCLTLGAIGVIRFLPIQNTKRVSLRIDQELSWKLYRIAEHKERSVNEQIVVFIPDYLRVMKRNPNCPFCLAGRRRHAPRGRGGPPA